MNYDKIKAIIENKNIQKLYLTVSEKEFFQESNPQAIKILENINKYSSNMIYGVSFGDDNGLEYHFEKNHNQALSIIKKLINNELKFKCLILDVESNTYK